MSIDSQDFPFYRDLLYKESGLALTEEKLYLLVSRLTPVSQKWKFESLKDMTKALKSNPDKDLLYEIIDAMTTNETFFFRDDRPFKYLREHLIPHLEEIRGQKKSLRIWSAASSTGQESYSILMTLMDVLKTPDQWKIDLKGTDISLSVIEKAKAGLYSQFEVQRGVPIMSLAKYFKQEEANWRIDEKLRSIAKFEYFNLLQPMHSLGTFDVIFCRNVLIYFDQETKIRTLKNMIKQLSPDGYLILGGAETAINICPELKPCGECPGVYVLESASAGSDAQHTSLNSRKAG